MPANTGPYDTPHLYCQWGGKLPGGDVWSCGVRFAATGGGSPTTYSTAHHTAVTSAIKALHIDSSTQIGSRALLSFVKLNVIDTNGKYAEQVTHEQILADFAGTGAGTNYPANQVALAVSLLTQYTRGPAHRGRFYLPLPVAVPGADGLVSTSAATNMKTALTTWVTAMNAADSSWKLAVFSRKASGPAHNLVTGVAVGRVLDTQRRRRNALKENYM